MKRLRHILQSRYLFKILVVLFLTIDVIFINLYEFKSKYDKEDNVFIGDVYDYEIDDKKLTIYMKGKEKIIIKYNYGNLIFDNLAYGDKLLVKGTIMTPSGSTIFNTFDYKDYLYRQKIYYVVKASSIDKIENNKNYFYTIKNLFYEKVENLKSSSYIKTFLLGDNKLSDEVKESYRINGISHLFSISSMHVNLITGIIYFYLDKITRNKILKYVIVDLFLLFYLVLAFSSSLLRSTIMALLFSINFIFKFDIKKIDIMFLTLIIAIIINPFIIYDVGFIYSYIISFFLVIFSSNIKNKSKIIKSIYITLLSFLVSFPITIYYSYEINIISIFLNIILVPIVSIIIFPLTIVTFVFSIFDDILYFCTNLLEEISLLISEIDITKIIFSKPSLFIIIIYYIVIILVLKKIKYFYLLVILLIGHYMMPFFDNSFKLIMFDVGQGDSFLINYPNNKKNILIDGGDDTKDYSKIENGIIPYLKSVGIRKIDYFIITHGDYDHMGEAINLVENFKVEKVIFNCGEFNDLEKDLIKVLDKKKIPYYSCIKELNIDDNKLYFLNNKIYDNENDNSSVIYTELNKHKFLFMGDAGVEVEDDLIEKYNLKDVDVLKVGHHGSRTSSSKSFIDEINPKYSIISVGKNNRYGHPNKEVLENLDNSKIYRTDQDGSIIFKIKNNKLQIENCNP